MNNQRSGTRGNLLVTHPYRKWFDDKIIEGLPINYIYGKQTEAGIPMELHVSKRTIGEYRNNILKPNKEIIRITQEETIKEENEETHHELMAESQIQTAVLAKAESVIDAEKTFNELHAQMKVQIAKLANIEDSNTRTQIAAATALGQLVDQTRLLTTDWLRVQGKLRDAPTTQINIINIERNNAQMDALKTVIGDIITEIDPSMLPRFFELLKTKVEPVMHAFELKERNAQFETTMTEAEASAAVNSLLNKADDIDEDF